MWFNQKKVAFYFVHPPEMAVEKLRLKLTESLNILFYITMLIGCLPYSFLDYRNKKIVNATLWSSIFVAISTLHVILEYHFVSLQSNDVTTGEKYIFLKSELINNFNDFSVYFTPGSLTKIIGICMLYFEPLMLLVDVCAFIINRHIFIDCLTRMERIDDKLLQENISINYHNLRKLSVILIGFVTALEVFTSVFNFIVFRENNESIVQALWLVINLCPVYFSSLSKIWFIILVFNIRQKFIAINDHLEHTQKFIDDTKGRLSQFNHHLVYDDDENKEKGGSDYTIYGYLHKEIFGMIGDEVRDKRKNQNYRHMTKKNKVGIMKVMPAIVGISTYTYVLCEFLCLYNNSNCILYIISRSNCYKNTKTTVQHHEKSTIYN